MSIKYDNNFLNRIKQDRADGMTQSDLMERYNLTHTQIKYVYRLLHNRDTNTNSNGDDRFEFGSVTRNADGSAVANKVLAADNPQDLSDTDLLNLFGYNPDYFKLDSFKYSAWGKDKETGQPLISASVKVSPITQDVTTDKFIDVINNEVQPVQPVNVKRDIETRNLDENLIIPLFDLHFGITDIETAYVYLLNLQDMIQHNNYRHILIVFGGDVFHSDFMTKTQTAKNTQLDHVDNVKALQDATSFFDDLIRSVHSHADNVDVISIGGNHDYDKQYLWMYAMSIKWQKFANFHLTTGTRQYFQIGHVMLAVLHGDQALNKIANLMSTEEPKMWADSTARVALSGHFHKNLIRQVGSNDDGVMLYQCSTIKPNDKYELDRGFTMSGHRLEVFTLNDHRVTGINYLYDDPLQD
ncbi:metallophosphoesterase [Limosilactobacillus reuteri]|uniref:metallophosphoesterase n=1 Tax=Limosilactobacillus reuteri TaxID=1598 RepID=UPI003D088A7C